MFIKQRIELPGSDLGNIFPAMEFLTASNRKGLGDRLNCLITEY